MKQDNDIRILILTQKVDTNDDVLGFMHGWINEFARRCKKVTVISLYVGNHNLPDNVRVFSLGKEDGKSCLKYLYRFYKYIWQERKNYNTVFVHMNPEYVVLGGLFWRFWKKKLGLWYTHKSVNLKLKIAEKFSSIIFTASRESFRLKSNKVNIMGHGIDLSRFKDTSVYTDRGSRYKNDYFRILTVGRISPVKDYETLIKTVEIIKNKNYKIKVEIVGGADSVEQKKYLENLRDLVKEKSLEVEIKFVGSIPNKNILNYYKKADLFAHMSNTGSLDKVVLESFASKVPVISCNQAVVKDIFGDLGRVLSFQEGNAEGMAEKIIEWIELDEPEKEVIIKKLSEKAREHSLDNLILRILEKYE